jgi:hypothetical protein
VSTFGTQRHGDLAEGRLVGLTPRVPDDPKAASGVSSLTYLHVAPVGSQTGQCSPGTRGRGERWHLGSCSLVDPARPDHAWLG